MPIRAALFDFGAESGRLVAGLTRRYPDAFGLVERAARDGERGEVVRTLLGRGSPSLLDGRAIAVQVLESFPSCPIPEIARLARTLRAWKEQFLAYFTTGRANNGGTEAINGISELHRRIARGFRNRPTTDSE